MTDTDPPTRRELDLVRALIEEPSLHQVARRLGLSTRHTRRLLAAFRQRLNTPTNTALVATAVQRGWIQPIDSGHPETETSREVEDPRDDRHMADTCEV